MAAPRNRNRQPRRPLPAFVGTGSTVNGQRSIDFRAESAGGLRMIYRFAGDDALIARLVRDASRRRNPRAAERAFNEAQARPELTLHAREMLCPRCGSAAREGARYCPGAGHELPPWPAARTRSDTAGGPGRLGGKGRRAKIVATLIKEYPTKRGRMAFLSLSRPVAYRETYEGAPLERAEHAVASESASYDPETGEPIIVETAIFPAWPDGRIASHRMLRQLPKVLDWRRAVERAGWELVERAGGKARAAAACPGCGGKGCCAWCGGKGCVQCARTGLCAYCGGPGARRRGGKRRAGVGALAGAIRKLTR